MMRYTLVGVALLAALLVACSKPKEEQGAMSPAGSDVVAPQQQQPMQGSGSEEQAQPAPQSDSAPAPAGNNGGGSAP